MRLVCPNCDAQYEVDDAAIPEGGRDVQCSNCGHAWFQLPPAAEAQEDEAREEAALFAAPDAPDAAVEAVPDAARDSPAGLPADAPAGAAAPVATAAPAAFAMPDDGQGSDAPADAPAAATAADGDVPEGDDAPAPSPDAPPRRRIDEAVMTMLREEAERETAARRAEAARTIETQPDLGLTGAAASATAVQAAVAGRPAGAGQGEDERPVGHRHGARRDLLPDIEEINSTLRAGSEAREGSGTGEGLPDPAARSGFRTGFVAMLVVAGCLAALYVLAPRIAQHLPGSAGAMESYVGAVDSLRVRLDGAIKGAVSGLRGLSGGGG